MEDNWVGPSDNAFAAGPGVTGVLHRANSFDPPPPSPPPRRAAGSEET